MVTEQKLDLRRRTLAKIASACRLKKLWLLALLIPAILTYGAIFSTSQHWANGYLSHRHLAIDHMRAFTWAIFPPAWLMAPFLTKGYEDGLKFRHHHKHFCAPAEFGGCEQR